MALVTVTARVASTHPVAKYGGVRLSEGVLRQMEAAFNSGTVPMNFDHSSLAPLQVQNLVAEVVDLDDGELALDATFEIEEDAWSSVESEFVKAGVPGGWSFTAGEPQIRPPRGRKPLVVLSADAAVFSDSDRMVHGRPSPTVRRHRSTASFSSVPQPRSPGSSSRSGPKSRSPSE